MKTKTNYTLIGAFIMSGVGILVAWILTLKGASDAEAYFLETYFEESVNGLSTGSAVRFRGVKIGEVKSIHIAANVYETQYPYVVVTARLHQKGVDREHWQQIMERRGKEGLFVRLTSQGLTGAMYLEADIPSDPLKRPQPLPHDWTPRFTTVPSEISTIAQLRITIEAVALNLRKIDFAELVDEMNLTLKSVRTQVDAADLATLSQKAQSFLDEGTLAVKNVEQDIADAGKRAEDFLARLDALVARLDGEIEAGRVQELIQDMSLTARQLPDAAKDLKLAMQSLMGSANQLESMIRLKGRDVDLILENVRVVTANLARLSSTLERYPSLLLFGDAPKATADPGVRK